MLDRRTLPLSALRAFESAGRHLHLGRAGEELGVTHGAISHQIRALEEQLGVKLFIRANNRLQLSAPGQRLLEAITEGFDRILDAALHLDPDSLSGRLTIGCTQTVAHWISRHICEFQRHYQQIEIHTMEVKPQQRALPPEIDIAICFGKPHSRSRNIAELVSARIFPVCSPRLLHDRAAITTPQELTQFPLLHNGLDHWERWLAATETQLDSSAQQIYFFNTELSLNAARQGYGVALGNQLEVQEDLREGRLTQLLDITFPDSDNYYLLSDMPEKQSLRAQLFEDWIKQSLGPLVMASP